MLRAQSKPILGKGVLVVKTNIIKKIKADNSSITIRTFNPKALKQYQENPDFNYYIQTEKQKVTLWDRFWAWFWHLIESLFPKQEKQEKASPILLKYLLLVIVIVALVYIVIKLLGDDLSNIFTKRSKEVSLSYLESLENIHEISFEEEIEKALQKKDFRLAVRLLYLDSLKTLNDAGLIKWQIEKTNATYLKELKNENQKTQFSILTRQFEFVWYGDFYVNQQSFESIKTLFANFKPTV